ncbi:hypothetical protein HYQ46_011585 [Verticillium longisporum]|nr:hypothetical protein HYQ46_011585 [Verticillium longisporum]
MCRRRGMPLRERAEQERTESRGRAAGRSASCREISAPPSFHAGLPSMPCRLRVGGMEHIIVRWQHRHPRRSSRRGGKGAGTGDRR